MLIILYRPFVRVGAALQLCFQWRDPRHAWLGGYLAGALLLSLFGAGLLLAGSALAPLPPQLLERMSALW